MSEIKHQVARQMPRHAHQLAYFSLLLNGGYKEHFGHRETIYKPMTIMFHPAEFEHWDEIGGKGGRLFSVEVHSKWLNHLRDYTGSSQISTELHSGELVWTATRLFREHREFDACSPLAVEGLLLEMLAIAGRASEVKEDRRAPAWLDRVIDVLQAEFRSTLTLEQISSAVGVNEFHLSRVFRKFKHQTISEFTSQLRIDYCCAQLSNPELSLADIALDAGFADQSHFTRTFKRVTGFTPDAFRRLLAAK